jgi:uncharacterized membrane protein
MYWWVAMWLLLGIIACVGVLYLVYQELHPEQEE